MRKLSIIITLLALLASIVPIYSIFRIASAPDGDANLLVTGVPTILILGGLSMGIVKLVKKSSKAAIIYSAISLAASAIVYIVIIDSITK